jgi:hypothetical protein
MKAAARPLPRPVRFFFMHLGSLVGVVAYVVVSERAGYSAEGVGRALWIALGVHGAYALVARAAGELKHFDVSFGLLWAVGAVAAAAGVAPVLALYQRYSAVLIFGTLALTAAVPLLLGRSPFTMYFAVRQAPRWQHRTPAFAAINRVMSGFWALVFVAGVLLAAARPADPTFTFVLPNLLVLLVGLPAAIWLPPLYLRLYPPAVPDAAEPLIMGMPLAFDRTAAGDTRAVVQFRVTGPAPGDYWLRVADGRCESFEGTAPAPDLTVTTPDAVWVRIARGELDGGRALADGLYAVDGDLLVLAKLGQWFRTAAR